ncbi:GWxTD domain-containing protein [Roseivirga pacifica]|uniref:GWxTD domain-containing protein n=1 Tax=Roseivirga pacifica TaxID=1267423 RepID=UPI00227CD4F1|nr:GWxTD domain-containing protein [Roseivirga pacifica]
MRSWLIGICLVATSLAAHAQSRMSSAELSYQYNLQNEFLMSHKLASQAGEYKLFLHFSLNSGNVKISDFEIKYDLRSDYMDERDVNSSIQIDSTSVIDVAFREFVFEVPFSVQNNETIMVVDVYNIQKDKHYYYDIPLKIGETAPASFLVYQAEKDIPLFQKYLNKGIPVRFKNVFGQESNYQISGMENNRAFPAPPFDEAERGAPLRISIDTLFGANENEVFTFHNQGFYKISASNNTEAVVPLLVMDNFYPYYEDYSELVKPLVFLSTNEEFTSLRADSDTRAAFELFVQNTISSNEKMAKDFIKYYYRRLRKSAWLFSSDREGWKTDRGMVYQIFGDPIQVFRNENTELWVYSSAKGGKMRFVFELTIEDGLRKYKLLRGKRYREDWMTAVTQWRAGRIIE